MLRYKFCKILKFGLVQILATWMCSHAALAQEFTDQVSGKPIDSQLVPVAREIATEAARGPGLPKAFPEKRAAFDQVFGELGGPGPKLFKVENLVVTHDGVGTRVRIYRPSEGDLPVLVWAHGGGFEKGSLDSHDGPLRRLAKSCHCAIVAVDYRLAPEHKFPAQLNDVFAVLEWVADQAPGQNFDPERIAIGGDSVGGNLAAVNAIRARNNGRPALVYQVLLYPVTNVTLSSVSWKQFAKGPWLTRAYEKNALQKQYLPQGWDLKDPLVSPLFADLSDLPPAFVANAEFDGYRDQGQAYAWNLRVAGVEVVTKVYPGVIHDFFLMTGRLDEARELIQEIGQNLKVAFQR